MNSPAVREISMTQEQALARGRESMRQQSWTAAYATLTEADRQAGLEPDDLEQLSRAALLIGKENESAEFLTRAHQAYLNRGETRQAARCAGWLSFLLLLNGETAQASGWLSRARRLLEGENDCLEKGYLLYAEGYQSARAGQFADALKTLRDSEAIGKQFGDKDLATMSLQGKGRVLIKQGKTARGIALLDEAMVAIQAGEVSPMIAGGVYCSVIEACGEILDMRRAREWTLALERWCASQPDLVAYRGHCLIRRAEILQMHGDWSNALGEAQNACERLSSPAPKPPIGAAFYLKGELHRLRGEYEQAETAYHQASRWERVPRPGLARLWLAQGKVQAAYTAVQQLVNEAQELARRALVLDAAVEISLAAKDPSLAHDASEELSRIANALDSPLLHAVAARAAGAVCLSEGNERDAVSALRSAIHGFRELEAPYEEAVSRLLLARACHESESSEPAELELKAACEIFKTLGAEPDLARAESLLQKKPAASQNSLTSRELEVLRLVASGRTNRTIAQLLHISEKTVARHVSNIFNKLDLSSRAAATAYAYQRGLA